MLKLTNADKIFWKKEKISKGELLEYYNSVSPYILPQLRNRPLVLHRFPDGISGEHFFQKESGPHLPSFIKTVQIRHETRKISYFVAQNLKSLLYVANLGAIELHTFHARITRPDRPDYALFDLDRESAPFTAVVDTALALHHLLEEHQIPNFCKTSGGRGMHLYVPLKGRYSYEVVQAFVQLVATVLHAQLPSLTSLERNPAKRKRKIYIDILQNHPMQSLVAPYSVRGFAGAPVATPLEWKEVTHRLDPSAFNLRTVPKRLERKGDLFNGLLKQQTNLRKAFNQLRKLL